tara:strand:- start:202 stop:933 length:732 start_codon:yes stop_codon:yes gene_type:complete
MRLLLLAAGKSSRIYNKIKKNKCLININQKSLIRNIVDSAYKNKIEKIDIITGFKPNNIKKDLKNYKKIRFINNSKYSSTDMVYSALLGLKKTKIDTIISYTDIIYKDKIFKILSSNSKKFITIPYIKNWKQVWKKRKKDIFDDAETFKVDSNLNLKEIGNKINKKNLKSINGQFMGIIFIPSSLIQKTINKYKSYKNKKLQFTGFINMLVKDKVRVKCLEYNDFWYEIDDIEDFKNYKKIKK